MSFNYAGQVLETLATFAGAPDLCNAPRGPGAAVVHMGQ